MTGIVLFMLGLTAALIAEAAPTTLTEPVGISSATQPSSARGGVTSVGHSSTDFVRSYDPRRNPRRFVMVVTGLLLPAIVGGCLENGPRTSNAGNPVPVSDKTPGRLSEPPASAKPVMLSLPDALSGKQVTLAATGAGLHRVTLYFKSTSASALTIQILRGTVFTPQDPAVQAMVVTEDMNVVVAPGASQEIRIPAACLNMKRKTPEPHHILQASTSVVSDDIARLMATPGFSSAGERVRQYAIWLLTDNPKRSELPGIGLLGGGEGPTTDELRHVQNLVTEAALNPRRFTALR